MSTYDLLIVGCGINGAGIARDAAGRGLSVAVCDRGDPGGETSSSSSKLIHGGLRYLEHRSLRLVREALKEREILARNAPHLVRPMEFVLPTGRLSRSRTMIRLGLKLYDWLGGANSFGSSRSTRLNTGSPYGSGLREDLAKGFVYPDCWGDDARLVIANLQDADLNGADVMPRMELKAAERSEDSWSVTLRNTRTGRNKTVEARVIINATGPWAEHVARRILGLNPDGHLRLVQGSHIVVRRLHDGDHALLLQHEDGRVVFVVPFEEDYSLIGTTELTVTSPELYGEATEPEILYLCKAVSEYFREPVTPDKVIWSYAGVRPLFDDGSYQAGAVTRGYRFRLNSKRGAAALTVYGGKLTTYRRLAERALDAVAFTLPAMTPAWTEDEPLPGGDIPGGSLTGLVNALQETFGWIPREYLMGMVRRHGSRVRDLLRGATGTRDLGKHFGAGLYAREVRWFMEREWASNATDVLWRRSKLGLHLTESQKNALAEWMKKAGGGPLPKPARPVKSRRGLDTKVVVGGVPRVEAIAAADARGDEAGPGARKAAAAPRRVAKARPKAAAKPVRSAPSSRAATSRATAKKPPVVKPAAVVKKSSRNGNAAAKAPVKPAMKTAAKKSAKAAPKMTAKTAAKTVAKPASKPAARSASKSTAKAPPKAAARGARKSGAARSRPGSSRKT